MSFRTLNPKKGDIVLHSGQLRAKITNLSSTVTDHGPDIFYYLQILEGIPQTIVCLRKDFIFPAPEMTEKIESAAHHEAGHMVIAAVQGLKLRPDGFMVDLGGNGLARYCTQPDDSDASREAIVLSTFAGFAAEKRFCDQVKRTPPDTPGILLSPDWQEARKLISELSTQYLSKDNVAIVQSRLEHCSELLVERHWQVIQAVASALLTQEPQPVKPLNNGDDWSYENSARAVVGAEVVEILSKYGIHAICEAAANAGATI